ncbi:DUF4961 domain-containing protein [Pedobacter sp.]|uniref:DUF4961 domain-containing protein n=1 Tax=Pedobacter sp. TaxID=1411316 RepID=UPI003D7FC5DC
MKKLIKNIRYLYLVLGVAVVIFLTQCGLDPFTIEMPASGDAGKVVTFTLKGSTMSRIDNTQANPTYATKLLIGIMVPKSWNARQNTVVAFTSPKGNETMVLIPDAEIEPLSGQTWPIAAKNKLGIGPNLFDDFEWIIYRSNAVYTFKNNEDIKFDVKVNCKLGPENMVTKLGFYMGSSRENLNPSNTDYNKIAFSNQFEVKNGEGDLIDFINPQLSKIEPVRSIDNDIVTLTFDAGVTNTALSNTDDLYLCAKAFDQTDAVIAETCEQTTRTKLTALGGKRYRIDLWARGFFNVPSGATISRIEYYYTNSSGTVKVGYGNTADPFKFTFKCQ